MLQSNNPIRIKNLKVHGQLWSSFYDIIANAVDNESGIETIKYDVNYVTLEKYGNYYIVLVSRVVNGIKSPKKVFSNLNEIANKYVFITLFGPNNWKLEKDFFKFINGRYKYHI